MLIQGYSYAFGAFVISSIGKRNPFAQQQEQYPCQYRAYYAHYRKHHEHYEAVACSYIHDISSLTPFPASALRNRRTRDLSFSRPSLLRRIWGTQSGDCGLLSVLLLCCRLQLLSRWLSLVLCQSCTVLSL